MFAGNFAPRDWAFCDGRLLSIAENDALFVILGTTYGGDGVTTFGLPDLRGRRPLHWGQGPGLSSYVQGQQGGTENVTLLTTQMPAHTHVITGGGAEASVGIPCANSVGTSTSPVGMAYGVSKSGKENFTAPNGGSNGLTAPLSLGISPPVVVSNGGSQPHDNLSPTLAVSFIIALYGIFPSRN